MDLGHWHLLEGLEYKEDAFGFVYRIDRVNPGPKDKKHYWGCKQMVQKKKLAPLKGKKRFRRLIKESDWKTYTGSSNELNADIAIYGKNQFKFVILQFCSCKWQLKYEELKTQMHNNVLLRDDTYNGIINARLNKVPKDLKTIYEFDIC